MLGRVERKSSPQPVGEEEGSNQCLQVLEQKQYKIPTAVCKDLMGGGCSHPGCVLAVGDPYLRSKAKELESACRTEVQAAIPATSGCAVGEMVLPSAGLGWGLSSAALPSAVQGPTFQALVLPRAAASTVRQLGLHCVCGRVFHAGEGCVYIFRRAWVNQGW